MPPRYAVEKLPAEQFDFVIRAITNGGTDTSIPRDFEAKFGLKLAKSSLARWRATTGNELADRYRFVRAQANQIVEDLKDEGDNKYKMVIDIIEDRLLTSTKELIAENPLKLLNIQQEEKRRELKQEELQLKREQLDLEREKLRGAALDRVKLGEEFSGDLLEYIGNDPEGLRWFQRHIKKFSEFLQDKYPAEART
jgi:hypothetical protein